MFRPTTRQGIRFRSDHRADQIAGSGGPRAGHRRGKRTLCLTTAMGAVASTITVAGVLTPRPAADGANTLDLVSARTTESAAAVSCARARIALIAHKRTGPGTRRIAGHRYSEDTIPAFVKAMHSGADGFETDYWPTQDGPIISHHDPTLNRMTNGTGAIFRRSWRYVGRVRNVSGAAVPTATAVQRDTERYGGQRQQEFKRVSVFSTGQLRALRELNHRYVAHSSSRVLITASRLSALRRVGRLDPSAALGLITLKTGRPALADLPRWLDVVLIDLPSADARYIHRAHARGLEVSVRNVNNVRQLHRAVRIGADRAVTDRPERLGRAC